MNDTTVSDELVEQVTHIIHNAAVRALAGEELGETVGVLQTRTIGEIVAAVRAYDAEQIAAMLKWVAGIDLTLQDATSGDSQTWIATIEPSDENRLNWTGTGATVAEAIADALREDDDAH
jgi:hypothetical protein